ncbi:MAG: hypothetical protein ABUT11_01095 [Leifsonia sp.]
MTDATPTPSTPAAPAAAGPKQTLSIVGFILGLASVVFGWVGIIGIGAGIAAIIVSTKAKKSEPGAPSWMPTVGLIAGIVGIVIGLISGLVFLFLTLIPLLTYGSVVGNLGSY